jgi:DNA-directed RNA polymerase specialized sigma24 family protein
VEELETAEVAKLLGILQVTVRRHLMIAHEKIRALVGEGEEKS